MNVGANHSRIWWRIPPALGSVFGWSRRGSSDFEITLQLADAVFVRVDLDVMLFVVDLDALDVGFIVLVALPTYHTLG